MAGLLGVPGLDGYRAALQDNQARDMNTVGLMQGVLGLQNGILEQQMTPLKIEQLKMQMAAYKSAAQQVEMLRRMATGGGVLPTASEALAQGAAQGDVGPTVTNAARMEQPQGAQQGQNPFASIPPVLATAALSDADPQKSIKEFLSLARDFMKPSDKQKELEGAGIKPGSPEYRNIVGSVDTPAGRLVFDPATGGMKLMPGYAGAMAETEGAKQGAQANYTLAPEMPLTITKQDGSKETKPVRMTVGELVRYTQSGEIPARFGGQPAKPAAAEGGRAFFDANYPNPTPQVQSQRDSAARDVVQQEQTGGRIPTNTVIGMGQPPEIQAAANEMGGIHAKRVGALEEKIPSLNSTLRRLDRVEMLTKDDKTYAAAGAELKTQLNSIAQAVGVKMNVDKTANTEQYIADLAELLKERLASKDYGSGTGVSNLDLATAGRPLPEVVKTAAGRLSIINALRADTQRALKDAQAARSYFQQNKTLDGFTYPSETEQAAPPNTANSAQNTASPGWPPIGHRQGKYEYLGGNPNQRSSWRPVNVGAAGGF